MNTKTDLSGNRNSAAARPSRQINVVLRSTDQAGTAAAPVQETAKAIPNSGPWLEWQRELDRMVGLDSVKELVYEIYALLQIAQMRGEAGLHSEAHVYHMIFKGNPGTGKTTVARLLAKLFQDMGLLSKGHLVEVERADLVGEYIGHTAQKTRDLVKKALGGVLFIDEAYSLARGGEKDFGKEAIDTLVKAMEDYKNQFVLILAGYTMEIDFFLLQNPGLPSRFPIQMEFPDYSLDQLVQIAEGMARERDYAFLPQSLLKLRHLIVQEKTESPFHFSNARFVRNVLERAIRNQAVRLLSSYPNGSPGRQELVSLKPEDLRSPAVSANSSYASTAGETPFC
ncbi:AAA family ATPase [Cohnella lubricantis]|uniref:AAA family ATPase n=1 Tax=Cohnella lubricantis TaxID=2163172 RepID=A0A841TDW5_9BACL|nr:AAA family ATPase [Cohnella lubricantis]MBB6679633.1 AAA family ATPase [Cohnella lubricantis]MBP2118593.1 stage V sporulation protein K [Cohnella lubricantis]